MSERSDSRIIIHEIPADLSRHTILTGDRPTGPLHLGHFHGTLRSRVALQGRLPLYVLIADVQALTDNAENPEKVRAAVYEVMLDYLAVGIDPTKATIYVQSAVPETAELTLYYMNLVNLGRLMRNPTVKTEMRQKGYEDSVPVGFLAYPINQAADISQFKATIVPVGEDQVPMIEQTNDIARAFNRIYKADVLRECCALVPTTGMLPGTDGSSKMSKSLNNAIYLGDPEKVVAQKVKGMFTDPTHLRVEDPGRVEGNPVFSYLDVFETDRPRLDEMKAHYTRGGLGDGVVKKRLGEVLEEFLRPIRTRREDLAKDKGEVMRILQAGTERARGVVQKTLDEVRRAIGVCYF